MKTIIVGCGRVGSVLADTFDRAGHHVIVIDTATAAFDRLPGSFGGEAVRGDGTDEDTLRRAGAEDADLFMAMTEGDNRNVMASQLAAEALGAKQVIAKINDPLRANAYASLGLATLCRTNLMAQAVSEYLGLALTFGPGLSAPTGQHPGGEHHAPDTAAAGAAGPGGAVAAVGASPITPPPAATDDAAALTPPGPVDSIVSVSTPVTSTNAREG
ncbi:MAG TPA: TrkA family potassium uptake protein [Candidatus Limnocylindrales bacterium]|nr:TrkA family potassium uptake protein [Candidatus Limnocylindrales bacterium]